MFEPMGAGLVHTDQKAVNITVLDKGEIGYVPAQTMKKKSGFHN